MFILQLQNMEYTVNYNTICQLESQLDSEVDTNSKWKETENCLTDLHNTSTEVYCNHHLLIDWTSIGGISNFYSFQGREINNTYNHGASKERRRCSTQMPSHFATGFGILTFASCKLSVFLQHLIHLVSSWKESSNYGKQHKLTE